MKNVGIPPLLLYNAHLSYIMYYIYMVVHQLTIIIINENCCSAGRVTDNHLRISSQGDSKILCAFNHIVNQDGNICASPSFPRLKHSHCIGQTKVTARP